MVPTAYLEEIKHRYRTEQPAINVQLQLNGMPIKAEDPDPDQGMMQHSLLPIRVNVINSLFTFATSSPTEERERRITAINALTALCRLQEGSRCPPKKYSKPETKQLTTPPNSLSSSPAPKSIPIVCKPTQCIFCIGDESLPAETVSRPFMPGVT